MSTLNKISRKEAAKSLKVAIRTVDRYIKSGKLIVFEENGRKWLNEDEVRNFQYGIGGGHKVDNVDSHMSTYVDVDNVDNRDEITQEKLSTLSIQRRKSPVSTYKKLYEQAKVELIEKQERLEIANYRVGQLETQLRNSIPLLQYHQENTKITSQITELKLNIEEKITLLESLSKKIKQEKTIKQIYVIILLIIMALQPLWILGMK